MSNGEVKRWKGMTQDTEWDDSCRLERRVWADLVLASDHDRVVAELKAQLEHSETKVGWLLRDNEKNVSERDAVIAKQAKVIEKLKEELIDVYEGHRFDVDEMPERVAAIERGEA